MSIWWLHCNKCYKTLLEEPERSVELYLRECGHILCQSCLRESKEKCRLCGKATKYVKIDKSLDASIKKMFLPVDDAVMEILQNETFQRKHQLSFIKRKNIEFKGYMMKYQKLGEAIKQADAEISRLKQLIMEKRSAGQISYDSTGFMNKPSSTNSYQEPHSNPYFPSRRNSRTIRSKVFSRMPRFR